MANRRRSGQRRCRFRSPLRRWRRLERPERRSTRALNSRLPRGRALGVRHRLVPVSRLLTRLGGPVFVGVIYHQPMRREHSAAVVSSLHHNADSFAEHLRRHLGRRDEHGRGSGARAVRYLKAQPSMLWIPLDAAPLNDAAKADGRSVSALALPEHLARAPVVDEILPDVPERDEPQGAAGYQYGGNCDQTVAGGCLHCVLRIAFRSTQPEKQRVENHRAPEDRVGGPDVLPASLNPSSANAMSWIGGLLCEKQNQCALHRAAPLACICAVFAGATASGSTSSRSRSRSAIR